MRVYSWKLFLITLVLGSSLLVGSVIDLMGGDLFAILYVVLWGYLFIKGMWASLTEEGFKNERVNEHIHKKVSKELFGDYYLIAPWGGLILLVIAWISINLIPSQEWIAILLLFAGIIYHLRVGYIVRKYEKIERRNRFL